MYVLSEIFFSTRNNLASSSYQQYRMNAMKNPISLYAAAQRKEINLKPHKFICGMYFKLLRTTLIVRSV